MKKIFTSLFDDYIVEGDTITAEHNGFTLTATIYRDDISQKTPEDDCGFWPSLDPNDPGYIGPKSPTTLKRHMAQAKLVLDAWKNDEWFYCGVDVTVSRNGIQLTDRYQHALWGVDCNYPQWGGRRRNGYLTEVANELAEEAIADAWKRVDALLKVASQFERTAIRRN
jgi:hypothetical protein